MNVFLFHLQWFTEVDSYIIQTVFLLYNRLTHQSILTIIIFPSVPDLEGQPLKWRPQTRVRLSPDPTLIVSNPPRVRFSLNVCSASSRVNRQMKRSITLGAEGQGLASCQRRGGMCVACGGCDAGAAGSLWLPSLSSVTIIRAFGLRKTIHVPIRGPGRGTVWWGHS